MPTRKEINREKRRVTHASREALRPPEQRIDRIDFDTVAYPLVNQTRLQAFKAMREWLQEFFEEILHRSDSEKHFQGKDSAILTIAVGRKFFFWLSSGRHGRLADPHRPNPETTASRCTLNTIEGCLGVLCGTLKYFARPLETEVRQQILWWIRNDMVQGGCISYSI